MPGGSAHTAGGSADEVSPSYFEVVRHLPADYYLNFHKRPCVRDSQLTGIGAGFVGGSVAAIARCTSACSIALEGWEGRAWPDN